MADERKQETFVGIRIRELTAQIAEVEVIESYLKSQLFTVQAEVETLESLLAEYQHKQRDSRKEMP